MYTTLLDIHSILRYVVLLLLVTVILVGVYSLLKRAGYQLFHRILLSALTSTAHLQFLIGLILYFNSPWVVFGSQTMKNEMLRYWTVEHIFMMLLAVIFISVPGLSVKRLKDDYKKHKRTVIWTISAIILILVSLILSQRGIL